MKKIMMFLAFYPSFAIDMAHLRTIADAAVMPHIKTAQNDLEACSAIAVGIVAGWTNIICGYGVSTDGIHAPDGESIFQIGSVSKVFTGLILARMMVESGGAMHADDAVTAYLHEDLAVPPIRAVTLGELVSHHAGFPAMPPFGDRNGDGRPDTAIDPMSPASGYSRGELSAYLATFVRPEKKYRYSNIGIGLLAIALEDKCGAKDFHDMLSTYVLRDLGMGSTWGEFGRMDMHARGRIVQGYTYATAKQRARIPGRVAEMGVLAGAGAVVTTANDMCTFIRALTGAPTALDAAASLAVSPMGDGANGEQICFAVDREIKDGVTFYKKNGVTPSYSAYLMFRRDMPLGVIVLANAGNFRPVRTIGEKLMEAGAGRVLR